MVYINDINVFTNIEILLCNYRIKKNLNILYGSFKKKVYIRKFT